MNVRFALPVDINPAAAPAKTKSSKMPAKKRTMTVLLDDQAHSQRAHKHEHPRQPPHSPVPSTSMNTSHSFKVLRDRVVFPRCRQVVDAQHAQRRPPNQPQIYFGTSSRFDGHSIGRVFIESRCTLVEENLRFMAGSPPLDLNVERNVESDSDDDFLTARRRYYGSGNSSDQSDTGDEGSDGRRLLEQMHILRDTWHRALDDWEALQHVLAAVPRDVQRVVPAFDFDCTDVDTFANDEADSTPSPSVPLYALEVKAVRIAHASLLDTLRTLHALEDEPLTAHLVQARLYSFAMPSAAFVDPSCACARCCAYTSLRVRKSVRKPEPGDALVALVCRRADVLARVDARDAERVQMDRLVTMFFELG
ncbi:hypothetical protein BKA62DRAFT_711318, partial [Auriculariales sp. MPI-PUGE-AT-0066]